MSPLIASLIIGAVIAWITALLLALALARAASGRLNAPRRGRARRRHTSRPPLREWIV